MPAIEYEPFKKYKEVKGVFVGGCVDRGDGSRFRRMAHAHTHNPNIGWICVLSPKRLYNSNNGASQLMLHELAHILTLQGHTDKWREQAHQLGYRLRFWETKEYFICRKKGFRPQSMSQVREYLKYN